MPGSSRDETLKEQPQAQQRQMKRRAQRERFSGRCSHLLYAAIASAFPITTGCFAPVAEGKLFGRP